MKARYPIQILDRKPRIISQVEVAQVGKVPQLRRNFTTKPIVDEVEILQVFRLA
jgi:hypothetical protein